MTNKKNKVVNYNIVEEDVLQKMNKIIKDKESGKINEKEAEAEIEKILKSIKK